MKNTKEELQAERNQLFALQTIIKKRLEKNFNEIDAINVAELKEFLDSWWETPEKAHQIALYNWGSGKAGDLAHKAVEEFFKDTKPQGVRRWDKDGWKMTEDYIPEYAVLSIGFVKEDKSELNNVAESIRSYANVWGREDDPDFKVDIFEHTLSAHGVWFFKPFALEVCKTTYGRTRTEKKFDNLKELLEWVRSNTWYESEKDDYYYDDED